MIKAVAIVPARVEMSHINIDDVNYSNYSYILVPFCSKGSLLEFLLKAIETKKRFSAGLVKYIARQLLQAVAQLHNANKLAHLDLKPDNVVIMDDFNLSLIDFAHSHIVDSWIHKECGTSNYWPPELYLARDRKINYRPEKVDVFNIGIMLFLVAF